LVFYAVPGCAFWRIQRTYSDDGLGRVAQHFNQDFYDEQPTVLAVVAYSFN
jgi:hypothetical protein